MGCIIGGAIVGFLLLAAIAIGMYVVGVRNTMVTMEETVNEKWSQVQNVYQRRADLIPNLVSTVKGYAAHEKDTFEAVTKARASVTQISPEALQNAVNNPETFQKFQQAQAGLSSALSRLMVVVERYPELKANQNFLSLQSQLEGTENRITVERQRFNESAKIFNTEIRLFPENMVANFFGFQRKNLFEATKDAQTVPKVEF